MILEWPSRLEKSDDAKRRHRYGSSNHPSYLDTSKRKCILKRFPNERQSTLSEGVPRFGGRPHKRVANRQQGSRRQSPCPRRYPGRGFVRMSWLGPSRTSGIYQLALDFGCVESCYAQPRERTTVRFAAAHRQPIHLRVDHILDERCSGQVRAAGTH